MIWFVLTLLFFGLMYALKGGQGPEIFDNWKEVRSRNPVFERLLDGKVISGLLVLMFALVKTATHVGGAEYILNYGPAILFTAGWLAAVAPSIREELRAVFGQSKSLYIKHGEFGREFGIKKALQRGVWMGAMMALVTGYTPYICFSALFVPIAWGCYQLRKEKIGPKYWAVMEALTGALMFGVPTALWNGVL